MKTFLAAASIAALLSGCAPGPIGVSVTTGGASGASATSAQTALQQFTVTDLQAALADATAHNDTVAATCYTALIPAVQNLPSLLPAARPKGGFSAFQAARDGINGLTGLPGQLKALNVPCAPLVLDAETTIVGLGAKVGLGVVGAGAALP